MKRIIFYLFLILQLCVASYATGRGDDSDIFENVTAECLVISDSLPAAHALTYNECVDRALVYNTDIRQTLISILEADQDILSAKDAWLPTVDFNTSHSFLNYLLSQQGRKNNMYNSSYGVSGSWTVWEGNSRKYRLESAMLRQRQQKLSGADIVNYLKLNILQAYLNILYSHESIAIAEKTLEVSTAQTERMRKLVDSGRESKVDLAQIESQRAQDQYNVTQAKSELADNILTLKRLLMVDINTDIDVVRYSFPDSEVSAPLEPKDQTFMQALAWLPEFRYNDLAAEIAEKDVRIAKAGSAPNIALQGAIGTGYTSGGSDWGYQMGHGLNENIGVGLSVPIFDANKTKRAVAQARLVALETEVEREKLLAELSQTIESLYVQVGNARAKYESGAAQLASMEETSRLVDRQFELGLVNTLELLTAHNNLLNARLEQLRNKYMAVLAAKTIRFYGSGQIAIP